MRLFTAIDLPTHIRGHLAPISDSLRNHPALRDLSWTRAENLHITLKFLGDISDDQVPHLCRALAQLSVPSLSLTLNPFLVLPGQGPARILAANVRGDLGPLSQLFSHIESAVQPLGVRRESRPYKPHVTLARIKRPTRKLTAQALGRIVDPSLLPTPAFTATQFTLYQSQLDPKGSVYTPVARISSS